MQITTRYNIGEKIRGKSLNGKTRKMLVNEITIEINEAGQEETYSDGCSHIGDCIIIER